MKAHLSILIVTLLSGHVFAVDVIKTWTGAASNGLNAVTNWDNNQRPTFGAAANTDALLFTGLGTGQVNVNVDATAKSITVSGPLAYTFGGTLPLRLGDTSTGTIQPNTGNFINNAEAAVAINTSGGLFFRFGSLVAAGAPITVGANATVDIGNGSADTGRNLVIAGNHNVTVQSLLAGLGDAATAGGHLFKQGDNLLLLNGNSTTWNGRIFVEGGAVSVTRANSLGSSVGDTVIAGAESAARVEFGGDVSIAEPFRLAGRTMPNLASLINLAGNNVLSGPILLDAGGDEFAMAALGGDLEITGPVAYGTQTGDSTLLLAGSGTGAFIGSLAAAGEALGLVKQDAGKWRVVGSSAFTGPIAVQNGELELSTLHSGGGAIGVSEGATLALRIAAPGQALASSAVTVNGGPQTRLVFDLGVHGIPSVPVLNAGALELNSEVAVSLRAATLGIGQIPLIEYEGVIAGEGFDALSLTGLPPRVAAVLVHDEVNKQVLVQINGFDQPKWTGTAGADWDADDGSGTGTFNWREVISGQPTRFLQSEEGTDSVLFDDSATGPSAINLTGELSPLAITVNNDTLSYQFIGPGFISGGGTLTKQGSGTLRIVNEQANTFTGLTDIQAGTIELGDGVTAGRGSLGTGPIQNAGVLVLNRPDTVTVSGSISGTGAVIKRGAGIAVLGGNSDFTGPVTIEAGTLRPGTGGALGAPDGDVTVAPGATLDFRGQLLPAGKLVFVSGNGVDGAGAIINSNAGGPAVGTRGLVFTGPTTIGGSARWDIRDAPGGVQVNGHPLIKTGSNSVFWAGLGETGIANLLITGIGSRLAFEGDTTLGASPGSVVVEAGATLGFNDSTMIHTKPVRVEGGTINFSAGTLNHLGSNVTIVGEATINTAASTEAVISGKLTGNGSLTKTTGGILKLTNDQNDYLGQTLINAGQLWIGNDGGTGSLPPGDIFINGGTLIVRRWGELVLNQTISGSGAFQISNLTYPVLQEVTLTGNNSFTGAVTLARGTLRITHSNALGAGGKIINIQNGRPTLILDGSGGNLTLSSDLTFRISSDGPLGGIQNVSGDNVINSLINLFNQNGGHTRLRGDGGSLTINGDLRIIPLAEHATTTVNRQLRLDGDLGGVINGNIRGPELVEDTRLLLLFKEGAGTWLLNGQNTHTGATSILAGRLKLGAEASFANTPSITLAAGAVFDVTEQSAFTLAPGQILTGVGNIDGGLIVGPSAIVTPAAALTSGTFAISGDLDFAGGRVNFSFGGTLPNTSSTSDRFVVGGDLAISAPSVIDIATNGLVPEASYPLVEFSGLFSGDVADFTFINPTRLGVSLDVTSEPGKLLLVFSGAPGQLVWSGDGGTNRWDNNLSSSWDSGTGTFLTVDHARFDDTADAARRTVNIAGVLRPASITVDTETGYTFSFAGGVGANNISGATGLTKLGTGSLTLSGTGAFNGLGKTSIQGGSLILSNNTGGFTQTRWIELHPGTVLNASALSAGLNLSNTADERVLSGSGTVIGTLVIGGAAVIKPGLSSDPLDQTTAGDQVGVLTIDGNLGLLANAAEGRPRAVLRIGGVSGQVVDPFDAVAISSFADTTATLHDQIVVSGTLALDEGSTIRLELIDDFVPALGDVFNLADWSALVLDADAANGEFDPLAANAFDLPELAEGLYWNRSQFVEHGIVFISQAPAVVGVIEFTPGAAVNPGVTVTLSAAVSGLDPFSYQWLFNGQPIELVDNATAQSAQLVLTADEALEGDYTLVVTNPIGDSSNTGFLSVNDPIVLAENPQSLVLNPGDQALFSVAGTGTGPFTFQWRKNGTPIPDSDADTLVIASVAEDDEGIYDVIVTNVVGAVQSAVATLSVNDPVVILQGPQNQGAFVGGTASFGVIHTGTGPFEYRWFKGANEIPGAAGAQSTLQLSNITLADEGLYSVRVSNSVNQPISAAASLLVGSVTPKIVSQSSAQLVAVGQPVSLQVHAVGLPPLGYQWFKNGRRINGATSATLALPTARLTDAAVYRVDIIGGTTFSSADIPVGVVEAAAKTLTFASGAAGRVEARTAGTGLSHQWQKDGADLTDTDRIKGSNQPRLNLGRPLEDSDSGAYRLIVTGPGGILTTEAITVRVFTEAPVITEDPPNFPAAIVSGDFVYDIPVNLDTKKTPTGFAAGGLPPGLLLDRASGRISGKPTAVSRDPLGYLVTLTASNSKGRSVVQGRLLVEQLNPLLAGDHAAPIGRHAELNQNLGGLLTLKIAPRGTYTGRLFLGTLSLPVRGVLDATPASVAASHITTVARRGSTPLTLEFTLDGAGLISTASISDGNATETFNGWRNPWHRRDNPATSSFATYHTFGLDLASHVDDLDVPQGNGFGAVTLAGAGTLRIAGRLADGETLTASTLVGTTGQIAVFRPLYTTRKRGSVAGSLTLGDSALSGALTWSRPANPAPRHRVYRAGFPGIVSLTAAGGPYAPPAPGKTFLDLDPGPSNAILSFAGAGLESSVPQPEDLDLAVSIPADNRPVIALQPGQNPTRAALKLVPRTGHISGNISLQDTISGVTVNRTANFFGIALPQGPSTQANGYFLHNAPPPETATLSGQVTLIPVQ
jgi:autotransporter-associated beta strand protein